MLAPEPDNNAKDAFEYQDAERGICIAHRPGRPLQAAHFDPAGWAGAQPAAAGRGNAWFVTDGQQHLVLRRYLRGGKAALVSRDKYWYTGLARTRAWRELHLLARLYAHGLPVPEPFGALVERGALTYRAALLTRAVEGATSLGHKLAQATLCAEDMHAAARCVRRFHDAGVWHADLNANNILFAADGTVYLIDFDRGRLSANGSALAANVARLKRSLDKLSRRQGAAAVAPELWDAFVRAYS